LAQTQRAGSGSLRNGIQTAQGPRTIVFDVMVTGWSTVVTGTHDVVVRYLRFRPGDIACPRMQGDSFSVDRSTDVVIDHVSASRRARAFASGSGNTQIYQSGNLIDGNLNKRRDGADTGWGMSGSRVPAIRSRGMRCMRGYWQRWRLARVEIAATAARQRRRCMPAARQLSSRHQANPGLLEPGRRGRQRHSSGVSGRPNHHQRLA
jgi:hypothetical protein